MLKPFKNIETKLIHAGEPRPLIEGAVNVPIFQSSTFESNASNKSYHAQRYMRLSNTPNHDVLHRKLAALENAEAALVTASGMAAISTALLAVLAAGDHLLALGGAYGGTHAFITHELPDFGIEYTFIDGDDPTSWETLLRPNTKAILVESLTNPLLQVPDLQAVVAFAQEHGLISMIDNTFTTPINFRPPEWGFDLSLHSATKYLNGHSDIVAGAIIGREELVTKAHLKLNHLGGSLDAHACYLLYRGLKTLAVRMKQHNESALKIARYLENHPAVEKVNYPGLESHPRHQRAGELFDGFSGMLSFEVKGGVEAAAQVIETATLPTSAPSLGGVESRITRPATTSHSSMTPAERQAMGISDGLIRYSVGIEATADLIADLQQALNSIVR